MSTALELYYNDWGGYPKQALSTTAAADISSTQSTGIYGLVSPPSGTGYMAALPTAPTPADDPSAGTKCSIANGFATGGSYLNNDYMYFGGAGSVGSAPYVTNSGSFYNCKMVTQLQLSMR